MAYQPEVVSYDAGIYQLEVIDPVDGGVGAVSNSPLLSLANRTGYLYQHVTNLENGTTIPPTVAPLNNANLTGSPTTPTPALGDSSTKISNTAFVQGTVNGLASVNVAGGANVTLTSVQAGNGILVFTGALTANIAVIVPNTSKTMIVENLTSGAFTLTVKTAAGTGIAISQGKTQEVFCDGTNVLLSSSDFVNMALTGVPTAATAAPGTNTTQLSTTAFVTAAVAAVTTGFALVAGSATQVFNVGPATAASNAVQLAQLQARGINASTIDIVGATGTLPPTVAGGLVVINGAFNSGLPLSSSVPTYSQITIVSFANGAIVTPQAGDTFILSSSGSVASVTLNNNDSLVLVSTGSGWYGVGGSIHDRSALDNRYAALAGASGQAFNVANATAVNHAVNQQYGDGRYAALAGLSTQLFSAANATAATHVVNRQFGDARYAALAGLSTQQFAVATATVGSNAVNLAQMNAHGNNQSPLQVVGANGTSAALGGSELITAVVTRALPLSSTAGSGASIKFASFAAGCVLVPQSGGDGIITISGASPASLTFGLGDTAEFVTNGGGSWYLIGGSLANKYAGNFLASTATAGYQKLPSGLIIQWGNASTGSNGSVTVNYPITFPNAALNAHATNIASSAAGSFPGLNMVNTSSLVIWAASSSSVSVGAGAAYMYVAIGY
jgi:hypothetical protein